MNLLFLNSAKNWGGNEKWIYLATHALAKEHQVYFANRKEIVGERFQVEKIRLPFLNEFDFYTIFRLIFIVVKYKVEVLIPTKSKEYFLAGVIAKLCRRKNVIRLGIVRELNNSWIKNLVYNKLADGIIVNAHSIKAALLKSRFMKAEKIRLIYNGVNSDEIDSNAKFPIDRKLSFKFLVASMGQLSKRKSMDVVIRGFADFITKSKASDAGLVIIGRGEKLIELQVLVQKLGISRQVIFTGFLENPFPYLKLSQVFISTSMNEGISNSLLEAMYLRNVPISTSAGGTDYAIEHGANGFLLHENPVDEISQYLFSLYKNEAVREKMAENAHQTILKKFSLSTMKTEMIHYFQELIQQ